MLQRAGMDCTFCDTLNRDVFTQLDEMCVPQPENVPSTLKASQIKTFIQSSRVLIECVIAFLKYLLVFLNTIFQLAIECKKLSWNVVVVFHPCGPQGWTLDLKKKKNEKSKKKQNTNMQLHFHCIILWYQSSHLLLHQNVDNHISQNVFVAVRQ